MKVYPVFLSVVCVVQNRSQSLLEVGQELSRALPGLVSDYEIVFVDNASSDNSVEVYEQLTSDDGLPNLQVYVLTKEVDVDAAVMVGLENALGDFVLVMDPFADDLGQVGRMLELVLSGKDVVFARNTYRPDHFGYRFAFSLYNYMYRKFNGLDLARDAPKFRILSRSVVNFVLQHRHPGISFRALPAMSGFAREGFEYKHVPSVYTRQSIIDGVRRGMHLLFTTTRAPMRLVNMLSLFGALANVFYSIYVVIVAITKDDVAPGWVSLSLQQSGMFFLISLVLLVIGEYVLNAVSMINSAPTYHVEMEFTSNKMSVREKLNLEERSVSQSES